MQLSQYTGAGQSGIFAMDQLSTCEPFSVETRAGDLEELSKKADDARAFSYGLFLSKEFCPSKPLEVKWVNWRWPRYEYTAKSLDVKASIQWLVHNGVVLQQLVLENAGDASVRLGYTLNTDMLIRDLDYLNPSYSFNECHSGGPTYGHVSGPNGYGHVCVHQSDEIVDTKKRGMDGPRSGTTVEAQNGYVAVEDSAQKVHNDTPLSTELHSVAAVTTLFVNGEAVKMSDDSRFSGDHTLKGHSLAEFVVAYKMVPLPASGVHWENFLVTAEEADVSKILRDEHNDLWGNAEGVPLCSLGISTVKMKKRPEETTEQRHADSRESEGFNRVNPETLDDMEASESQTVEGSMADHRDGNAGAPVDSESSDSNNNTGAKRTPKQGRVCFPSGSPAKSSPKNHIEYLAWRHLEHILSVCAIPLSIPVLKTRDKRRRNPADDTAPVALTCGDMSGHRISTSASL